MGSKLWALVRRSKSAWKTATVTVALLAVAGISGVLALQPRAGHGNPALSERGAAPLPSTSASTSEVSLAPLTGTTMPALPDVSEPWVPATPSPAAATPVLVSNGPSDPVFYRLHISAPVVFVTIDDGWVRDPRVVDFVHQTGWPISIFLIERAAKGAPAYFQQLQAEGATVEDHTFDHPYLTSLSAERQTSEICQPMRDYPGLFGHPPTLLRPPYGAWNPTTARAARTCGLSAVVEWSATYYSGRLAIAGGSHLRPGDVILLHFNAGLYDDLVRLRQLLASQGLAVGRLESYITQTTGVPPSTTIAPGNTTTVATNPTSTLPPTSTTQVVPATTTSTSVP